MDTKEMLFGPDAPPEAIKGLDMERILSVVERVLSGKIPVAAGVKLLVFLGVDEDSAESILGGEDDAAEEKDETPPPAPVINVPAPQVTVVPAAAPEVNVHVPENRPVNARIEIERDAEGKMTAATITSGE